MIVIAIDGACRRNGKPDCIASSGLYIQHFNEALEVESTHIYGEIEYHSTNQRGELLALRNALIYTFHTSEPTQIITDSEYLFNTMSKEWYLGWQSRGWKTALGEPVKNRNLWEQIVDKYKECIDAGIEIMFYHIKGHCIPFGKVTATKLLEQDNTGASLYKEVLRKYDVSVHTTRTQQIKDANALSLKNNGFELTPEKIKHFVAINTMADLVATKYVDKADSEWNR